MKIANRLWIAGAFTMLALSPAYAGGSHGHGGGSTSSGWGMSSGGTPTSSSSSGGATSVPEPSDAVLLLMGATGVIVGRRLHARKRRG